VTLVTLGKVFPGGWINKADLINRKPRGPDLELGSSYFHLYLHWRSEVFGKRGEQ
jgi:hypothetical protein